MFRLFCLLVGYAVGLIQSAYVVGKVMKVDIRKHGSGNLGTTNALRVLGKRAGAVTFICDILKAVIAFTLCYHLFQSPVAGVYAAFGTVLGHDFPFYLGFKGGKGIASTIGMVLSLAVVFNPFIAVIAYGVGILGVAFSNTISLGSLLFSVCLPFVFFIFKLQWEVIIVAVFMAAITVYKHKDNIIRLRKGEENKFIKKKA